MKEKVLVTGAAGFIGSHLAELLLEKGYEVVCLLMPGESTRWIKDLDVTIKYGDLRKKESLHEPVEGVSYIYHLAARLGGGDKPEDIYNANSGGSQNLLEVCLETGLKLKRFLFVSSFAAAGATGDSGVFDEEKPSTPETDYGKSKLITENYLREQVKDIPYTIIRLPLVYGPRGLGGLYTVFKYVNSGFRLLLSKSETNVGFVKDIVRGMVMAAESPAAVGQLYYLGEDRVYSSGEITGHVADAIGKKTIKIRIPYFLLYSLAFCAEIFADLIGKHPIVRRHSLSAYLNSNWRFTMKKAKKELNYEAQYPLPEGLKITAKWFDKMGFIQMAKKK